MFQSGKVIKSGDFFSETAGDVVSELKEKKFTGYAAFTVKAKQGIEDSSVAFINGWVKGAFFECFKTREKLAGEKAIAKINRYMDETGAYDVVALSEEQVKLAIAVRPESEVKQVEATETPAADSSEEILKKYGLASLAQKG